MIQKLKPCLRVASYSYQTDLALRENLIIEQWSNDLISLLCKRSRFTEAIRAFEYLKTTTPFRLNLSTFAHLIRACAALRNLEHGREVHQYLRKLPNAVRDIFLQNHILTMYGKCGSLTEARMVFDEMHDPNAVSWTSMISGYLQGGEGEEAIQLYIRMLRAGLAPDHFTLGNMARACSSVGDVDLGKQLHTHALKSACGSHLISQNALIAMYSKFGLILDASEVFSGMAVTDFITWSSMIAGLSQLGRGLEALSHFREFMRQGIHHPNEFIFGSLFSACGDLCQPGYGMPIHGMTIKLCLVGDAFAGCSLCDMYAKCYLLDPARTVFKQIQKPDSVSWNAIISGFSYAGNAEEAFSLLKQMRHSALVPNEVTWRSLLCAFSNSTMLSQGKQIHSCMIKTGHDRNMSVCNSLLSMYAECSNLGEVFHLFKEVRNSADLVSWNAVLAACMQHEQANEVFKLLKLMLVTENQPDNVTLSYFVGACADMASLTMGTQAHCHAIKSGLDLDISITNALISMYAKCGSLSSAQKLFDFVENPDVLSWNSLILGYARCGYGDKSLTLFQKMMAMCINPNQLTFIGVLTACGHLGRVEEGWFYYKEMTVEYGITPTREHFSCVIDLLARAGHLFEAECFLDKIVSDPDIVMWKTLLAACRVHGNVEIGKRAAVSILNLDPSDSAAYVLHCNIFASTGSWDDVARLRILMKRSGVKKVPGQSWIEIKHETHNFFPKHCSHPELSKIYSVLGELWLQMLDAGNLH